ncbi:14396_t:CDS:2 [Acaulospora colombiana]|uniref:14396_t:CDS:1 n=1 Tax=Acaulospora colombiana TaxID=27376 RepID=A0ACA9MJ58_9GLOM|nr:14396_t:CDS:2 [Acaulospora colombiana]
MCILLQAVVEHWPSVYPNNECPLRFSYESPSLHSHFSGENTPERADKIYHHRVKIRRNAIIKRAVLTRFSAMLPVPGTDRIG